MKSRYNLTYDEYNDLLKNQDYRCAICNTTESNTPRHDFLAVDHCHVSKKVRGLLCNKCNQGIGLLNDSIENLSNAILYLENNAKTNDIRD